MDIGMDRISGSKSSGLDPERVFGLILSILSIPVDSLLFFSVSL
jgi:hypothetical protein